MPPIDKVPSTSPRSDRTLRALMLGSVVLVLTLLGTQLYSYYWMHEFVHRDLALVESSTDIEYLDEVLTMSARLCATTGDLSWAERYNEAEPRLAAVLEGVIALGPGPEGPGLRRTSEANDALVEIERAAIEAVRAGRIEDATALLFSQEYEGYKAAYRDGLDDVIASIADRIDRNHANTHLAFLLSGFLGVATVIGSAVAFALTIKRSGREQRLREELIVAERRSTLGRLAASLSHELNQPLAAVINFASAARNTLDRDGDRDTVRASVTGAAEQAERAGEILRRIRGFATRHPVPHRACDPVEAIRASVSFVSGEASARGVSIRVRFDRETPRVGIDTVELQQVLVNLLMNAIEVSNSGQQIDVICGMEAARVRIEVRDEAGGVEEEHQDRLFDSFFTTKDDGMGLGLAIVRDIIESAGGTVTPHHHTGGTTFRVQLPKAAA